MAWPRALVAIPSAAAAPAAGLPHAAAAASATSAASDEAKAAGATLPRSCPPGLALHCELQRLAAELAQLAVRQHRTQWTAPSLSLTMWWLVTDRMARDGIAILKSVSMSDRPLAATAPARPTQFTTPSTVSTCRSRRARVASGAP